MIMLRDQSEPMVGLALMEALVKGPESPRLSLPSLPKDQRDAALAGCLFAIANVFHDFVSTPEARVQNKPAMRRICKLLAQEPPMELEALLDSLLYAAVMKQVSVGGCEDEVDALVQVVTLMPPSRIRIAMMRTALFTPSCPYALSYLVGALEEEEASKALCQAWIISACAWRGIEVDVPVFCRKAAERFGDSVIRRTLSQLWRCLEWDLRAKVFRELASRPWSEGWAAFFHPSLLALGMAVACVAACMGLATWLLSWLLSLL